MPQPPKIVLSTADPSEITRQVNIAFEQQQAVLNRMTTGGVSAASIAALQAQIDTLNALSGAFIDQGGTGSGSPPPNPTDGSVATDGVTIGGDGLLTPIFLIKPLTYNVRSSSVSPDAVTATDVFIRASSSAGADIIENLPAATGTGRILAFKKIDANAHNVVVTAAGADKIDGLGTYTITVQFAGITILDAAAGAWDVLDVKP